VHDASHLRRIDALDAVWACWVDVGGNLAEDQWSTATRCPGWDVAAIFAHVGMFPRAIIDPPPGNEGSSEPPITAVDILRGFNAPGGTAHGMAEQVAGAAVATAAQLGPPALVALFAEDGPRAVDALRGRAPASLIPWPATGRMTTWVEALRIVLMESVVHLLDVLDGLSRDPCVPAPGLRETAHLLAEVAEPVMFIEAATGRSAQSPLPVLR
jgi:uncharacterized protein (TIGR03083 family)